MADTIKAPQIRQMSVGDIKSLSCDFTTELASSGASFTGTPTISEVTTAALTLTSKAINTATYVDDETGKTVAIGKALQCLVNPSAVGVYQIKLSCATDATPAETFTQVVELEVI